MFFLLALTSRRRRQQSFFTTARANYPDDLKIKPTYSPIKND